MWLRKHRKSLFDIALETTNDSVTVIEVSSFQLETVHEFRPDVSVILNITHHLNRYYTMENYIRLKKDIAKNQDMGSLSILNYEDEHPKNRNRA